MTDAVRQGASGLAKKKATTDSLKKRTRAHIIASLSVNSIERFFLKKGHTVSEPEQDYGVDLNVFTYDDNGYVEPGNIYVQLKATDAPHLSADGKFYTVSISVKDYNAWSVEPMPIFLVLYDSTNEKAYWQYVQGYLESDAAFKPKKGAKSISVRFPVENEFSADTVDYARLKKKAVLDQLEGSIKHDL